MLHLRQGKESFFENLILLFQVVGNKYNKFVDLIEQIENDEAQGVSHQQNENAEDCAEPK